MGEEDYILDIGGSGGQSRPREQAEADGRPFISVHFACCNVYQRVYRNRQRDAYVGWCPRCARKVMARIGPDGVATRFFQAT